MHCYDAVLVAGGGGGEDPEGGQQYRGEGGLPQRGRDDETLRSQGETMVLTKDRSSECGVHTWSE